jgi:pimeloyl-ACP methyl ester carboxylesterase
MFRMVNWAMRHSARITRAIAKQTAEQVVEDPTKFFSQWGRMQKADGLLFARDLAAVAAIGSEMAEAVQAGIDGIVAEHPLYKSDWSFPLEAIRHSVHVWHGLADRQAAPTWAHELAARLVAATVHLVPGEGHFSILVSHAREILQSAVTQPVS